MLSWTPPKDDAELAVLLTGPKSSEKCEAMRSDWNDFLKESSIEAIIQRVSKTPRLVRAIDFVAFSADHRKKLLKFLTLSELEIIFADFARRSTFDDIIRFGKQIVERSPGALWFVSETLRCHSNAVIELCKIALRNEASISRWQEIVVGLLMRRIITLEQHDYLIGLSIQRGGFAFDERFVLYGTYRNAWRLALNSEKFLENIRKLKSARLSANDFKEFTTLLADRLLRSRIYEFRSADDAHAAAYEIMKTCR